MSRYWREAPPERVGGRRSRRELTVLEVKELCKHYPTARGTLSILDGVSLTLRRGDSASIVGPSGSGKSTLLYMLGALDPPSSGTVTLDGTNPFSLSERDVATFRNTRVGFVFQDHLLLPQCTVRENVLLPTLIADPDPGVTERAEHLLEQVGLKDRMAHRPAELSGGERQRVALARALVREPLLLLCDEPTGNLDTNSADAVSSLLFDLHEAQRTILVIVTHNLTLADRCKMKYRLSERRLERVSS